MPAATWPVALALGGGLAGCGATEYRVQLANDLAQAVVVEGCEGCGGGRAVGPEQSVPLQVEELVVIKISMTDGTVVGCAYQPAGGSTSEPLSVKASDFKDLLCDTAPGAKR